MVVTIGVSGAFVAYVLHPRYDRRMTNQTFSLTAVITLGNDAMRDVRDALGAVSAELEKVLDADAEPSESYGRTVYDVNGNSVGSVGWSVTE